MKLFRIMTSFKRIPWSNQLLLTLILTSLIFNACKKNDLPYGEGTKLVKVIAREDDSVGVAVFKYDENERLINIYETVNNKSSYQRHLQYDNSGKLLQSEEVFIPTNSSWTAKYTYSNDRIIKKVNSDTFGDTIKNIYSYNSQGKLIADTLYISGYQNYSYTTFKYNSSENIEELEYFDSYLGAWQKTGEIKAMYNNAVNPYSTIGLMYYLTNGYDENKFTLTSKNLLTQSISGARSILYQYEYYSNGLPKKIIKTYNYTNRTRQSTIEFFYE